MSRLRYSDASKEDLKEIARFIAKDKPKAAREWVAKLREKCRMLAKHPEVGDDLADLRVDLGCARRAAGCLQLDCATVISQVNRPVPGTCRSALVDPIIAKFGSHWSSFHLSTASLGLKPLDSK